MPRAPLTPASVVAAAAELADRDGFDAIVLSAVARRLGVRTASLYSHIAGRAAVLDGVQTLAMGELADAIAAAVAGRSGRDALGGLASAQRDYARRHPGRWTSLQRPASPEVVDAESTIRLSTLMTAIIRAYALSDDDVVHATRMLGATVNGFINLETAGSLDHRSPDVESSWTRALDALDDVFRSWATPRPPAA